MSTGHGGPRPGAGRPPKTTKHLGRRAEVDDLVAESAPVVFANLRRLADGSLESVKRKYQAAALVTRKGVACYPPGADGTPGAPILDEKGKPTLVDVRIFPDLPADELVLIEEVREPLQPDVKANIYLMDRFAGRPPEAERDKGATDLDPRAALDRAHDLADAYVDPDDPADDEGGPDGGDRP